jgi:glycosyltransferase involved in cell wall biosynthesis
MPCSFMSFWRLFMHKNKNNLVSIIIPTYNREDLIEECVQSVFNQAYRPLEIIVVDDGSTDGTAAVLEKLKVASAEFEDCRFEYHITANKGAPHARNYGLKRSKGDYIVFLDSDDRLLPEKVEKQLRLLLSDGHDMVYSPALAVTKDSRRVFGRELKGDESDLYYVSWQTMCPLYKREYLREIGPWNEDLLIMQDYEYCIRAIARGGSIGYISEPQQIYNVHDSERIGNTIDARKILSRANAFGSMYRFINEQGLSSRWLKYRYLKSMLLCLYQLRVSNAPEHCNEVIAMVKELFKPSLALRIYIDVSSTYTFSRLFVFLFNFSKSIR